MWEFALAIKRKYTRRQVFEQATNRAKETGKKLLVIGDPNNGFFNTLTGPDYDYGDECIDLTGCPNAFSSNVIVHKGAVENILPTLDLQEFVIFQSCVFEYIEQYDIVRNLLENIAPEDLFFVNVEPWSLAAYIYPGFILGDDSVPKRVFVNYPPFDKYTCSFDNPFSRYNKELVFFCMAKGVWDNFLYNS